MRRVRVTDIGEYIRHQSCQRRFKLGYNDGELFSKLPFSGKPLHTMDPVLAEQGARREDEWAESLEDAGIINLHTATGLAEDAKWEAFAASVATLNPGQDAFAREVHTSGNVGEFHLEGRADFLIVRWVKGTPTLWIVECKASRKDRTYHRLQVVLYLLLIEQHIQRTPLTPGGCLIEAEDIACTVVRIDERTNEMFALADLEPLDEIAYLRHDAGRLLRKEGALERILDADLDELPFVLDSKCDDCKFSVHCFPESARLRRLHLLGLEPDLIRALEAKGICTLDDLAALDSESDQARDIRFDSDFTGDLDALIVRARARVSTLPGGAHEETEHLPVQPLPNRGQGHLPRHEVYDAARYANSTSEELESLPTKQLIRVFLSVNYDYAEDRIGALAAHITRSDWELHTPFEKDENDRWRPSPEVAERDPESRGEEDRETRPMSESFDVVTVQPAPWSIDYKMACGQESNLLQGFFKQVVKSIQLLAANEPSPIHFYVWSGSEITRLIESASRVGNDMLDFLRELFGCRETLEQLIYSDLSREIDQRYALGWTGRGLTVVTSLNWYGRYHWVREVAGEVIDLEYELSRDLFDFRTRLPVTPDNEWAEGKQKGATWHRYEVRSRFFDNLSAPYFHAYWGKLKASAKDKTWLAQSIRDYNHAGEPQMLEGYLTARVHAMRWLEERISPKNDSIHKPFIAPDALPVFELGTTTNTKAALDFLRLDHHIKYTQWLQALLVPPYVRVTRGDTLGLCNFRLGKKGNIEAEIDTASYHTTLSALRARVSYHEGGFGRLHSAPSEPHHGQSMRDLLYYGKTCRIIRLDWDLGEVELSVIWGDGDKDYYAVTSKGVSDASYLPDFATLDPSITDYVAGKVETRLLPEDGATSIRGSHIERWFNPRRPAVPPQQPLSEELSSRLKATLEALRLGDAGYSLDPRRVEIIMGGLASRIQLIQGPPGTGKSETCAIATLTRILARRQVGDIVFIAANTHTAVETLLERIADRASFVQTAARSQNLTLPPLTLAKIGEYRGEHSEIITVRDRPSTAEVTEHLEGAVLVVGGTTNGLIKFVNELDKKKRFRSEFVGGSVQTKLLIIDEASMMVAAHLMGIVSTLADDGELLMAGDHRQLTPIIAHDWENDDRPPAQYYRMHESAFSAIATLRDPADDRRVRELSGECVRLDHLVHSYRLPAMIRALIQPVYDQDGITLEGPKPNAATTDEVLLPKADLPLAHAWSDIASLQLLVHDEQASRKSNRFEVELIAALIQAGVENNALEEGSIAIMTPHRAQRALLEQELARWSDYITIIDTVERLQGGEQTNIIVSATVSDPIAMAQAGEFVLDLQRANVAFSRTKQRLFVVASQVLFDHIPSQVDVYATAKLWKHLRYLCQRCISTQHIGEHRVVHLAPEEQQF